MQGIAAVVPNNVAVPDEPTRRSVILPKAMLHDEGCRLSLSRLAQRLGCGVAIICMNEVEPFLFRARTGRIRNA